VFGDPFSSGSGLQLRIFARLHSGYMHESLHCGVSLSPPTRKRKRISLRPDGLLLIAASGKRKNKK